MLATCVVAGACCAVAFVEYAGNPVLVVHTLDTFGDPVPTVVVSSLPVDADGRALPLKDCCLACWEAFEIVSLTPVCDSSGNAALKTVVSELETMSAFVPAPVATDPSCSDTGAGCWSPVVADHITQVLVVLSPLAVCAAG